MSLQYAIDNEPELCTGPKHRGYLQFADGSFDETVSQAKTHWSFASGERIPITFKFLEHCCSEIIIGEDVLTEHSVCQEHAVSVFSDVSFDRDCSELAPCDYVNSWQRGYERLTEKVVSKKRPCHHETPTTEDKIEEQTSS